MKAQPCSQADVWKKEKKRNNLCFCAVLERLVLKGDDRSGDVKDQVNGFLEKQTYGPRKVLNVDQVRIGFNRPPGELVS